MSDEFAFVLCVFDVVIGDDAPPLLYTFPPESPLLTAQSVWATLDAVTVSLTKRSLVNAQLTHNTSKRHVFASTRTRDGASTTALVTRSERCDADLTALTQVITARFLDWSTAVRRHKRDVDDVMAVYAASAVGVFTMADVTLTAQYECAHRWLCGLAPSVVSATVYDSAVSIVASLTPVDADWSAVQQTLVRSLRNNGEAYSAVRVHIADNQFASAAAAFHTAPHWILSGGEVSVCNDRQCRVCAHGELESAVLHIVRREKDILTIITRTDTAQIDTLMEKARSLPRDLVCAADVRLRLLVDGFGRSIVRTKTPMSALLLREVLSVHTALSAAATPLTIIRSTDEHVTLIGQSSARGGVSVISTDASVSSNDDWMFLIRKQCHANPSAT